jgi:hypothetical protein
MRLPLRALQKKTTDKAFQYPCGWLFLPILVGLFQGRDGGRRVLLPL